MSSPRAAAGVATSAVATPPPDNRFVSKVRACELLVWLWLVERLLRLLLAFLPSVIVSRPSWAAFVLRGEIALTKVCRTSRVRPRVFAVRVRKIAVYVSLSRAAEAQLQRMAEGRAEGVITVVAYYHFAAGDFVCCDMRCHSRQNRNAATWNGTVRNRAFRISFCALALSRAYLFLQ